QDRLWQADLIRRTATGTLAELLGPGAGNGRVDGDIFFRHYTGGDARLRQLVDRLDPTSRTAVDGVVARGDASIQNPTRTRGVNAWIETATGTGALPVEYAATGSAPRPWTAQDVLAVGMLSNLQVGTTGADELTNAVALADLVGRLGPARGAAAFADTHWLDD